MALRTGCEPYSNLKLMDFPVRRLLHYSYRELCRLEEGQWQEAEFEEIVKELASDDHHRGLHMVGVDATTRDLLHNRQPFDVKPGQIVFTFEDLKYDVDDDCICCFTTLNGLLWKENDDGALLKHLWQKAIFLGVTAGSHPIPISHQSVRMVRATRRGSICVFNNSQSEISSGELVVMALPGSIKGKWTWERTGLVPLFMGTKVRRPRGSEDMLFYPMDTRIPTESLRGLLTDAARTIGVIESLRMIDIGENNRDQLIRENEALLQDQLDKVHNKYVTSCIYIRTHCIGYCYTGSAPGRPTDRPGQEEIMTLDLVVY